MLYVGVRFPSSFFRFGSAGVVVCVELGLGVELLLLSSPDGLTLLRAWGWMAQLVLGAVGY